MFGELFLHPEEKRRQVYGRLSAFTSVLLLGLEMYGFTKKTEKKGSRTHTNTY